MLLTIDIGNTNTVVGLFNQSKLVDYFRVASAHNLTSDEAGLLVTGLLERINLAPSEVTKVALGSVVPPLTSVYIAMTKRFFKLDPVVVSSKIKLPIEVKVDLPDQVGADRIANAVAAKNLYSAPAIVVDFGTATTFDVVSPEGDYVGGVIIPGPEASMAELARKAVQLFEVELLPPPHVVGKTTSEAMQSGLFHGTIGQVDHIIDRIIAETGYESITIIATGGMSSGVAEHSRHLQKTAPTLTLEGLRLIAESL
ncbi:MAG: type III pantothenate kinase [candidate division Zixibacteria bacterium]